MDGYSCQAQSIVLIVITCYSIIQLSGHMISHSSKTNSSVSKQPNDVQFYLYPNPADNQDSDILVYNDINSILSSRFDAYKKMIIYASGFMQNHTSDQGIKNAYLKVGFASTTNIIIADWGALSGNRHRSPSAYLRRLIKAMPVYNECTKSVYIVGRRIQKFISFLGVNGFLPPGGAADIHLVGTSLGAQIMGMVGRYYRETSGYLIGRITGIEPAAPMFQNLPTSERLDISDAIFVDALHANQGEAGWFGPIGGVDFFINGGGPIQPECLSNLTTDFFCSHKLSVKFYAKSILDVGRTYTTYSCTWPFNPLCYWIKYGTSTQFGEYCPTSTPYNSYYLKISSN